MTRPALSSDVDRLHLVPAPQASKAEPIKLLAGHSAEDAAVEVFSSTLDHFEANLAAFRASQTPESVHQMRVALRRLRAALGLFKNSLSGPALNEARERAKAIADALGRARNWDVFHDMLKGAPSDALAKEPSFYALLDTLELNRAEAYRDAVRLLNDTGAGAFLSGFRKTLAERDWAAAPEARESGSAKDFARTALAKLRQRALARSKGLATRTPQERHALRIALKKARYGAEFFQSLFRHGDEAESFAASLGEIQDKLGVYNDMETAHPLLDDIDARSGAAQRATSFLRGWFAHAAQAGARRAKKIEKRLKALSPFWE